MAARPKTGHLRNYDLSPYGDYEDNERIYFPITIDDKRFHPKELMYVVNINEHSAPFKLKDLWETGRAEITAGDERITALSEGEEILVNDAKGSPIPGYYEMWFSWAIHHQEDGVVWEKD